MLNLIGCKLHPAFALAAGPVLVAVGIAIAAPILCLVGVMMLLTTAWRWFETRGTRSSARLGTGDGQPSAH